MTTRVFVYGSLKRGFWNNAALEGQKFLGITHVIGQYEFVDLGAYPGVVRDVQEVRSIGGEVWEVDSDTLTTLDAIEGHPVYYKRQKVDTPLGRAWMYTLPEEYRHRERKVEGMFWSPSNEEVDYVAATA